MLTTHQVADIERLAEEAAKRAHPIFIINNWTYWDTDGVPSPAKLAQVFKGILTELAEHDEAKTIATGHLQADKLDYDGTVELSASVELGRIWWYE